MVFSHPSEKYPYPQNGFESLPRSSGWNFFTIFELPPARNNGCHMLHFFLPWTIRNTEWRPRKKKNAEKNGKKNPTTKPTTERSPLSFPKSSPRNPSILDALPGPCPKHPPPSALPRWAYPTVSRSFGFRGSNVFGTPSWRIHLGFFCIFKT